MSQMTTAFTHRKAPCGVFADGSRFRDRDDECVISDKRTYDCGCKTIRHEYHDGSVSCTKVLHDGTVAVDELISQG